MAPLLEQSDAELVEQSLDGDSEAFAALVRRHLEPSFSIAYATTGRPNDADDLVQEAFIHAYRHLADLRARERFGAWIAGIIRGKAANQRKAHARRSRHHEAYGEIAAQQMQAPREEEDDHEALWGLVESLPDSLRVPLLLYYVEGESTADVAARLQLTPNTARKRLQMARDQLRGQMPENWRQRMPKASTALRASILAAVAALPTQVDAQTHTTGTPTQPRRMRALVTAVVLAVGIWTLWPHSSQQSEATAPPNRHAMASVVDESRRSDDDAGSRLGRITTSEDSTAPRSSATSSRQRLTAIVSGRVTRADGTPARGRVHLADHHQWWTQAESVALIDGMFSFETTDFSERWLFLETERGYVSLPDGWVRPVAGGSETLHLHLEEGVTLVGRVVSATSDTPIDEAFVTLASAPNEGVFAHSRTDADGYYALPHLIPGSYQVIVQHKDFEPSVRTIQVIDGAKHSPRLEQPRHMTLELHNAPENIHDEGVYVSFSPVEVANAAFIPGGTGLLMHGTPTPAGNWTIVAPPAGSWDATFYRTVPQRRVRISTHTVNRPTVVDFRNGATWSGAVLGLESASVVLMDVESDFGQGNELVVDTDPDGHFRIVGVPRGHYHIGVRQLIGGWPLEESQPRWVTYFQNHRKLDDHDEIHEDIRLEPGCRLFLDSSDLPPHSLLTVRVTSGRSAFCYQLEDTHEAPGVLAIARADELPVLEYLRPGICRIELSIDGVRQPTQLLSLERDRTNELVLSPAEHRTIVIQPGGSVHPRSLAIQCPPLPARAQAQIDWTRTAFVRDRLPALPGTRWQLFAPAETGFHGWHYLRSIICSSRTLEGNVRQSPDGNFHVSVPEAAFEGGHHMRLVAPGVEPVLLELDLEMKSQEVEFVLRQ